MMRSALLLTLLLLTGGPAQAEGASAEVTIENFTFVPTVLTVARGTRVVWTNHDDMPHTVTSAEDPARTHSPVLDTDDQYAVTFESAGDFQFFCSLHPTMRSQVVVR